MAQIIKLKSSSTQSAVPLVGDLIGGELSVNTYDGKIFLKKNNGAESIVEIGSDAQTLNGQNGAYYLNYSNFTNLPTIDSVPTDGSTNAVQSDGVFDALAGKQDDLGFTPEDSANKGVANGYPSLGADSKIPSSQLPAIAITSVDTVANETAQLALTAEEGDVAIRTDESKTYIHNGGSAGTMADWSEMSTPTDVVLSVNGKTGAVTLTTSDIAEGTNLYYTDARVLSYVGGIINDSGTTATDLWSADKIGTFVAQAIGDGSAVANPSDPTVGDDDSNGNYVGQTWINTTNDTAFILVDATDSAAIWIQLSSAAGTVTGGNNVGTAGVGIYKGVNGSSLEFKKVNAGSSKVTITDDTGNNEVKIDINESAIDHNSLLNYDINEHRKINDSGTGTTDLFSADKILTRTIDGGTF